MDTYQRELTRIIAIFYMNELGAANPKLVPTVGRMVYFKTRGSLDGVFPPRDFAAIVTRVYEDGDISVMSIGEAGVRFEVKIKQGQEPGQWDWMPFQKDQQLRAGYGNTTGGAPSNLAGVVGPNAAS